MGEQTQENMNFVIREGERLDDLIRGGLKIIQSPSAFCFSMDAVLLANFSAVKKRDRVVDLGTGTGVIPLLLSTRAEVAKIVGVEIQEASAERAKRSIVGNGLENLITIIHGDVREAEKFLGVGSFDLVTSNPPYLPVGRGCQNQTGEITIARHEVMCSLRDVVRAASRLVKYGGRVAMVHRPERLADLIIEMNVNQLRVRRLQLVYPGPGKRPNMVLVEAQLGGNPELVILEPFFVYNKDGIYTRTFWDTYYPGLEYPGLGVDSYANGK